MTVPLCRPIAALVCKPFCDYHTYCHPSSYVLVMFGAIIRYQYCEIANILDLAEQ